jgi:SAM-dependent methyltransferase
MKTYDRAYFDKWYRRHRVHTKNEVRRKVTLAVSVTEYFLQRDVRSVLDVGCGEAAWLPHLRDLRPRIHYLGIDPSEYAVKRYGEERNIRQGGVGDLPSLGLRGPFDLVVCSDVLHYVEERDLRRGVREMVTLAAGVVFFEVLTAEDDIVGDLEGLIRRPAAWYRKLFRAAGLRAVAPYSWLAPPLRDLPGRLEAPA